MWNYNSCNKLLLKNNLIKYNLIVFYLLLTVTIINGNNIDISSYSKVSTNTNTNSNDGANIHRAREGIPNFWYPEIFNKSQSASATTSTETLVETGRRFAQNGDARPFPFPLANPVYDAIQSTNLKNHRLDYGVRSSGGSSSNDYNRTPHVIYPANSPSYNKSPGIKVAMDRYSPSEAYSFTHNNKKQNGYHYEPPKIQQTVDQQPPSPPLAPPMPPPTSPTYIPPKNLYSFPPINSNYGPPVSTGKLEDAVSSYLPPAAGPADDYSSYSGSLPPDYLPPVDQSDKTSNQDDMGIGEMSSGDATNMDSVDMNNPSDEMDNHDHPPDHDHAHDHHPDNDHDHEHHHDHDQIYDHPPDHDYDHAHDHPTDHDHNHDDAHDHPSSSMEFELPPQPDHDHSHEFDFPDSSHEVDFPYDHGYKFSGTHGIDAFPEIIYDHDPHHHHYEPPPKNTTTAPPPEPSEPRVKQYSYYYIGRKLWYIPLYFTVWFTFYITYLILQSIGRHTVDLPNHTVVRRSVRDLSHEETVKKVDRLTVFVMSQIEDFHNKYL